MSSNQITLFDLPSSPPCRTWSNNAWKTRLLLNFKGLDYKTEWIEYPNIKARLESHIAPNAEGAYTIPAIQLSDGTYNMDSKEIAYAISERFPLPHLPIDSPHLSALVPLIIAAMSPIPGAYLPLVPKRLLNPASQPYFYHTREKAIGMSLDQLATEKGGENAWKETEPALKQITELLAKEGGPFFAGKEVCYADFVWAAILLWFKRMGDDVFGDLLKAAGDGRLHLKLLEAVRGWSERDSY